MAKGYGWGNAFVDGMAAADRSMNAASEREAAKKRGELMDRQIKAADADAAEKDRVRQVEQGRRDDLKIAAQPDQVVGEDGQSAPGRPLRSFEVLERAAKRRYEAGDIDGYEKYVNNAAAMRTKHYTDSLEQAYRNNDLGAGLALLNDFPDGIKYSVERGQNGALVGSAVGPDGKPVGRQEFKSEADAWSFISSRAQPGNNFQQLRQKAQDEIQGRKDEADIKAKDAAAAASASTAAYNNARATNESTYGPQEARAKIGLYGAQAGAAVANAGESRSRASLADAQAGSVKAGFGMDGKPPAERADPVVSKLIDAYLDPIKRTQLTPDQTMQAERILSSRPGATQRPGPRPENLPGSGSGAGKSYSNLWK